MPAGSNEVRAPRKEGEVLPAAMQFYLRALMQKIMGGEPPVFTEKDFTEKELNAIRAAVENVAGQENPNVIGYGDYPTKENPFKKADSILGELAMIMNDPARSVQFALGMANVNNGVVTDQYNFGAPPEVSIGEVLAAIPKAYASNNPRAPLNLLGNLMGLRSGTGPQVRINLNQLAEEPVQ